MLLCEGGLCMVRWLRERATRLPAALDRRRWLGGGNKAGSRLSYRTETEWGGAGLGITYSRVTRVMRVPDLVAIWNWK